jgi:hypothetical protein
MVLSRTLEQISPRYVREGLFQSTGVNFEREHRLAISGYLAHA